jgi:hypothetical protein
VQENTCVWRHTTFSLTLFHLRYLGRATTRQLYLAPLFHIEYEQCYTWNPYTVARAAHACLSIRLVRRVCEYDVAHSARQLGMEGMRSAYEVLNS